MKKLLVFGLSTLICLVAVLALLEIYLRLFSSLPPPNLYAPHGERGWALAPNARLRSGGIEIRTNRFGFRDGDRSSEKPPGVFRVVVLGDSVTMGWGVEGEETFSSVLERLLNGSGGEGTFEVLNLGVDGYRTVQEASLLREAGLRFHPDLVLLAYILNDPLPFTPPSERKIGWPFHIKEFMKRNFYVYGFFRQRLLRLLERRGVKGFDQSPFTLHSDGNPGWADAKRALREIGAMCAARDIPCLLVLFPVLGAGEEGEYPYGEVHRRVEEAARSAGMEVLDLTDAYGGIPGPDLWVSPADGHPNVKAHRIAAGAIFSSLEADLSHKEDRP